MESSSQQYLNAALSRTTRAPTALLEAAANAPGVAR
jgi:hypothetical protein